MKRDIWHEVSVRSFHGQPRTSLLYLFRRHPRTTTDKDRNDTEIAMVKKYAVIHGHPWLTTDIFVDISVAVRETFRGRPRTFVR